MINLHLIFIFKEIQHLRQNVITAEQQLRLIQSPTYLPHDRQKAMQEQNVSTHILLNFIR